MKSETKYVSSYDINRFRRVECDELVIGGTVVGGPDVPFPPSAAQAAAAVRQSPDSAAQASLTQPTQVPEQPSAVLVQCEPAVCSCPFAALGITDQTSGVITIKNGELEIVEASSLAQPAEKDSSREEVETRFAELKQFIDEEFLRLKATLKKPATRSTRGRGKAVAKSSSTAQ